ncbi:Nuclear transcription factor Y subunit B-9 [Linum grandiflorum]
MPRNNRRAPPPPPQRGRPPLQPEEKDMPVSNIMRIMKRALPPNAKITNASKETVQRCVTEYINFVTVEASARCKRDMRTTLTADDLLWALGHLGFDSFLEPLIEYRDMYRKNEESLKAQAAAAHPDPTLLAKPTTPNLKMLVGDDRNFLSLGGLYDDAGASSSGPVLVDYFKDRLLGSGSGEGSGGAGAGGEDGGGSQSGLPKF